MRLAHVTGSTRQEELEQARQEVQETLHKIAHKFINKYRHLGYTREQFNEVMSEVYLRFIKAYDAFDGRGSLGGWVWTRVSLNIRDVVEEKVRHGQRLPTCQLDDTYDAEAKGPPFVEGLLADLSEDAATVVRLICEQPEELVKNFKANRARDRKNYIGAVCRTLKQAGWTYNRLINSFREIRKAIR